MPDHISDRIFRPNRRAVMAGLAAIALQPSNRAIGAEALLALRCKEGELALREKQPATAVWSLGDQALRFKRGDLLDTSLGNELSAPVVLNWRGMTASHPSSRSSRILRSRHRSAKSSKSRCVMPERIFAIRPCSAMARRGLFAPFR